MGGWKLEVGRMALYITFPVILFHIFNRPELHEEWVLKTKRKMYPREDTPENRELAAAIKRIREEQEAAQIKKLENSLNAEC